MHDNIGRKIKGSAKVIFLLEAASAVIAGAVIPAFNENLILIGLLIMVTGPLSAWISTWILYGFGELIDKICDIERNTRGCNRKSEAQSKTDSESKL